MYEFKVNIMAIVVIASKWYHSFLRLLKNENKIVKFTNSVDFYDRKTVAIASGKEKHVKVI